MRDKYFMKKKSIIKELLAELDRLINGTQIGNYQGYSNFPFCCKTSSHRLASIDLTGRLMEEAERVREYQETSDKSAYQFRSDLN